MFDRVADYAGYFNELCKSSKGIETTVCFKSLN